MKDVVIMDMSKKGVIRYIKADGITTYKHAYMLRESQLEKLDKRSADLRPYLELLYLLMRVGVSFSSCLMKREYDVI